MSLKMYDLKYKLAEHNPSIIHDDSIFNSLIVLYVYSKYIDRLVSTFVSKN